MARQTKRLNARGVATITRPGMHADGDGLYLVVDKSGAKRWAYIFQWEGKRNEMGLGPLSAVPLADARDAAQEARQLRARGINPIKDRERQRNNDKARDKTFGSFVEEMLPEITKAFKNDKHIAQWGMTLREYAKPLWNKRLDRVDTSDVLSVLTPIWHEKAETASRLRGRIERILGAAKVKGYRDGENPALWRGHLDQVLPRRKSSDQKHHPAMPFREVAGFVDGLKGRKGVGTKALLFDVITAGRSSEIRLSQWSEFDLDKRIWTVPPERMKMDTEHRVPLTDEAMAILEEMQKIRVGKYVFPGQKKDRPISETSVRNALIGAGGGDYTIHGFRSTFRDWAGDETNFHSYVAEAALAHAVGDKTERAYRRSDALARRRKLMVAWENYIFRTSRKGNVVNLEERPNGRRVASA